MSCASRRLVLQPEGGQDQGKQSQNGPHHGRKVSVPTARKVNRFSTAGIMTSHRIGGRIRWAWFSGRCRFGSNQPRRNRDYVNLPAREAIPSSIPPTAYSISEMPRWDFGKGQQASGETQFKPNVPPQTRLPPPRAEVPPGELLSLPVCVSSSLLVLRPLYEVEALRMKIADQDTQPVE